MRRRGGASEDDAAKDDGGSSSRAAAASKSKAKAAGGKRKRPDGLSVLCRWIFTALAVVFALLVLAVVALTVTLRTMDVTLAEDQRDKQPPPTPNSYRCCIQSDADLKELGHGNINPPDIVKRLKFSYDKSKIQLCQNDDACQELAPDAGLDRFLNYILPRAKGKISSVGYKMVQRAFSLSRDDTNSVMHILRGLESELFMVSEKQWRSLLDLDDTETLAAGLDIGAGHGDLAFQIKPLFNEMYTTEVSWVMNTVLSTSGFVSIKTDRASPKTIGRDDFDVVFALNVLDRCDDPWDLIIQLILLAQTGGRVVISIPVPYLGFTKLPLKHVEGWEKGADTFINEFLTPIGFSVEKLTRVPYLCQGIAKSLDPVFVYDVAIFVLTMDEATLEEYRRMEEDDFDEDDGEEYDYSEQNEGNTGAVPSTKEESDTPPVPAEQPPTSSDKTDDTTEAPQQ